MPTISELVVKITGDTKGLTSSLTDSQKKLGTFAIGAAAAAAAVVAVGKAVAKAAGEFADYGSAIFDASQKTGMSTDAIQEWKYIAEQSGTTIESVTTSFGYMTRALETNEEQYRALGIEIRNSDGTMRSANDVFNETVSALSSMTNVTERDQLAFQLLGRGAQSLIPILNAGTDEIKAMREQAHNLGIVLDKETITNADRLGDATDSLKAAFTAAKNNMVNELAPALIKISEFLADQIQKTLDAKRSWEELERAKRGEVQTEDELALALQAANESLARQTQIQAQSSYLSQEQKDALAAQIAETKKLIATLENARAAQSRYAAAEARGAEDRRRLEEEARVATERAARAAEEAAKKEAERVAQEQAAIRATEARIAAEVRLRQAISAGREQLFEEMAEFDAKTIESDDKVVEAKEANAKQLVTVNKTAANDIRTAWKKALDESAKQFKAWGEFAAEQGKTLVGTFADATMALGEALANGEDAWASMGKVALQALASVLEAIGYQLAALAVVHALALDVAGAIAAGVGSAAAFVGAGLIKGWSNQFAMGTDFAPGGRAVVGERGPEVVNVPRGASVTPAHRTMTNEGGSGIVVNIHSPVALNPSEASAVMKQTMRELAFVGAL